MENGISIYNGCLLLTFSGKFVENSTTIDYPYSLPYAALMCELANDCEDY